MAKKTGAPYSPKAGERERAIEHVVYEYANFLCAAHLNGWAGETIDTLMGDVFLLNCRKMGDFFKKAEAKDKDDVRAEHYYSGTVPTFSLPTWQALAGAMDKQLAHITYSRLAASPWEGKESPALLAECVREFERFLKTMDRKYRAEFIQQLSEREATFKKQAANYERHVRSGAESTVRQLNETIQALGKLIADMKSRP